MILTSFFLLNLQDKTGTVAGYEVPPPHNILKLPVVRQAGRFGSAVLYWEAILLTAGFEDFTPSSGNLTFTDGQVGACLKFISGSQFKTISHFPPVEFSSIH